MRGKIVLITGGAQGMGRAAGMALAALGAEKVLLVDWQGEEGTRARDAINAQCGRAVAEFLYCDLSSIAAVKSLAAELRRRCPKLDVLINNAGITDPVRRLSVDGWEMHLATCHLGHFILSNLLLAPLRASGAGRILCISSAAYRAGPGLDFDDLNNERIWNGRPASNSAAFQAYHRAKLSNIYMMQELHERLGGREVAANAASPGYFINTSIHRQLTGVFALGAKVVFGLGTLLRLNSPEQGARTQIWLASSPEAEGASGKYFENCEEKPLAPLADNPQARKRLWRWSEEVTGVSFPS